MTTDKLTELENLYATDPNSDNLQKVNSQTRVVNQIHIEKARQQVFFCKQRVFEHGERAGKLLAYLAHLNDKPPVVVSLVTPQGDMVTDPPQVAARFQTFYGDLYKSQSTHSQQDIQNFLRTIQFPKLNLEQIELLEAPITQDDITEAISQLSKSKAPGLDGLPLEFYDTFSEVIIPKLKQLYQNIFDKGILPSSMQEAQIKVLPKAGKDPRYPESYRPISLLQGDIKILAKILASRLNKVILSLIHPDQTGFMPGKNTAMNVRRLFMNIQARHDNRGTRVVVALDTAKAFDSVEWQFLWECLREFGFRQNFIKWVQILYQTPKARVFVNGWLSEQFPLERGTRQGCPLSPLLYALAAEPLAIAIRAKTEIVGLRVDNYTEKIGLYADDTILYLADQGPSLQTALRIIEQMGSFSGLRINWDKSQILPIDHFPPPITCPELPLARVNTIKYLGVKVTRELGDYITNNVEPLFQLIKTKTQAWSRLPLGVTGRINIIKMILLPKMLYMVWHAPLYIPLKFFKKMEAILNSFVWGHGRHKLAWHILKNPTAMGGMALPDLQEYYIAAQLSHMYYFNKNEMQRYKMLICDDPKSPLSSPLQAIFRGGLTGKRLPRYNEGMLTHHQKIWGAALKRLKLGHIHSHTPLWLNNHLPELKNLPDPHIWARYGIIYLHQVLTDTRLKTFQSLKDEYSIPHHLLFKYLQLRHALRFQLRNVANAITHPQVLEIIMGPEPQKLISNLYYTIRLPRVATVIQKAKSGWEKDVGDISDSDWDEILDMLNRHHLNCQTD